MKREPGQGTLVTLQRLLGPFRKLNGALAKYLGERHGYHFIELIHSPSTDYPPGTVLNVPLEALKGAEPWQPTVKRSLRSLPNA
jgi:hypothetical protein